MTMKARISPLDLELLSAYLDQQLDARARAGVEARLKAEAELRAVYEELRQTRLMLRSLPRVRAPRNFTLIPEQVSQARVREPARRQVFPVFQFASALASLLLMIVLVGDYLSLRALPTSAPSEPGLLAREADMTAEMEQAVEDRGLATESPEVLMKVEGAEEPTGEAEDQEKLAGAPAPELTPTPTPSVAELPQPAEATPVAALPPGESQPAGGPAVVQGGRAQPDRTLWRVAEIALALVALASGLVAFILRKAHRAS